jgi:hypothetical protein
MGFGYAKNAAKGFGPRIIAGSKVRRSTKEASPETLFRAATVRER